jgi:hypothetical protein
MVPRSSGDSIAFWCPDEQTWIKLEDMRFEEAKVYKWQSSCSLPLQLRLNEMPLPTIKTESGWEGEILMPFQSGEITFYIKQTEEDSIQTYLYPDERKLTERDYQQLISDILEEAKACFQHSGAQLEFEGSGVDRGLSLPQWDYIERTFYRLQYLFREIEASPIRRLQAQENWVRREKVKQATPSLLAWAQRHSIGVTEDAPIPSALWTNQRADTYDIYENQVVLQQLSELRVLLRRYENCPIDRIQRSAGSLGEKVAFWQRSSFLQDVRKHSGTIAISQAFRKHPMYRNWFSWFQQLYQFDRFQIGMKHSIPLKDTFQLYEIWVFMQMVKLFREHGRLQDASSLFAMEREGLVLNLSEKKEHRVRLSGGGTLSYQRWFTKATQDYVTYTHGMKPDIVLETDERLYVFDPKYRLDHNLPMALGEMHKYRDGIVRSSDGSRAVEEVYIITPVKGKDNAHFFEDEYHQLFKMGAFCLKPGLVCQELDNKLLIK